MNPSPEAILRLILTLLLCAPSIATQAQSSSNSDVRVDSLVGEMSLEEKIDYIGGTGFAIRAMPNLHLPAFEMSDGPLGVPLASAWQQRGIESLRNESEKASDATLALAVSISCWGRALTFIGRHGMEETSSTSERILFSLQKWLL